MIIKILWKWCPNCKRLEANTIEAVKQLNLQAEIIKITDIEEIMSYDVLSTPCLIVDQTIVLQGKVASIEEIKNILSNLN